MPLCVPKEARRRSNAKTENYMAVGAKGNYCSSSSSPVSLGAPKKKVITGISAGGE
jgi:hypothetical protein